MNVNGLQEEISDVSSLAPPYPGSQDKDSRAPQQGKSNFISLLSSEITISLTLSLYTPSRLFLKSLLHLILYTSWVLSFNHIL